MSSQGLSSVLQFLRKIAADSDGADTTDSQLLLRFIAGQDEDAFTELVQRHGPLVWGVCQRVLHHAADAEDAFQATFLVLARRAGSISRPQLLASWLFGVAYRTALKVRGQTAKRRAKESPIVDMAAAEVTPEIVWAEVRPILDEEIDRLPAKYRVPFVLCYLQDVTNEEVARRLDCPIGTVASRLATARQRLRDRLTRRGIALSAPLLTTLLAEVTSAAVTAPLVIATTKTVFVVTAGSSVAGAVSVKAITLAEGVLNAMLLNKILKVTGFSLLALVLLAGTGLSLFAWQETGTKTAEQAPGAPETKATPGAPAPKEATRAATVAEVVDAFENNDALADEKFTDQRVRVEGRILTIRRVPTGASMPGPGVGPGPGGFGPGATGPTSGAGYVLTLTDDALEEPGGPAKGPGLRPQGPMPGGPGFPRAGPGGKRPEGTVNSILSFQFSKDARKDLAKLRAGQVVIVEGQCQGIVGSDREDPIRFRDCKIVSALPHRPE